MGTVFNSKVFKGVSISGKIAKGMAKNGVVFWKVQVPTDYILAYDFNGNTVDASVNGLNCSMTGTLAFDDGRKAGTQSLNFTNGCVKTILPLPVNSDKVTIAFWMKTSQTSPAVIMEISADTNLNNAFSVYLNDNLKNSIQFNTRNIGPNQSARTGANNGTWKHFVGVIDRTQNGANEILIYENGTLVSFTKPYSTDNNRNFVNNILFIGQRNSSLHPFVGNLQDFKVYNRVLSQDEITALYNE